MTTLERVMLSMKLVPTRPIKTLTVYYCRTGCAVRQIDGSDRLTIRPRADPANPGRRNSSSTVIPPVITVAADLNTDLWVRGYRCVGRSCLDRGHSNDAGTQNKCG